MWTATLNFVGAALVDRVRRLARGSRPCGRARSPAVAAALLAVVVALPSIGHAFEIRRSDGARDRCGRRDDQRHAARGGPDGRHRRQHQRRPARVRPEVTVRGNVTGNLVTGAQTDHDRRHGRRQRHRRRRGLVARERPRRPRLLRLRATTSKSTPARERRGQRDRVRRDRRRRRPRRHRFQGLRRQRSRVSGAVEGDVDGYAGTVTRAADGARRRQRHGRTSTAPATSSVAAGAVVGGTVNEQLVEREQRRNRYSTVRLLLRPGHAARRRVPDGPALALAVPRAARASRCRTRWPSCARPASGSRPP